nr:MAG TPA: hypothetical protein [Caudoviricetes sp.]
MGLPVFINICSRKEGEILMKMSVKTWCLSMVSPA